MGALFYTFLVRILIAVDSGRLRHAAAPPFFASADEELVACDIMTRKVFAVSPKTPIGGVPVVSSDRQVIGVVSETDIVYSLLDQEPQLAERLREILLPGRSRRRRRTGDTAAEVMSSPAITARADTPLRELTEIVTERRIKRIIIVDRKNRLAGIVSQIDIVKSQYA